MLRKTIAHTIVSWSSLNNGDWFIFPIYDDDACDDDKDDDDDDDIKYTYSHNYHKMNSEKA